MLRPDCSARRKVEAKSLKVRYCYPFVDASGLMNDKSDSRAVTPATKLTCQAVVRRLAIGCAALPQHFVCHLGELVGGIFGTDRRKDHALAALHPVGRSSQATGSGELERVNSANDLTHATSGGGRGGGGVGSRTTTVRMKPCWYGCDVTFDMASYSRVNVALMALGTPTARFRDGKTPTRYKRLSSQPCKSTTLKACDAVEGVKNSTPNPDLRRHHPF